MAKLTSLLLLLLVGICTLAFCVATQLATPAAARGSASSLPRSPTGQLPRQRALVPRTGVSFRLELASPGAVASDGRFNATTAVASSQERRRQIAARAAAAAARSPTPRASSSSSSSSSSSATTFDAAVVSGDGAYLTNLPGTGTPAVRFSALIDTGSDLIWRQCSPCRNCFPQDSRDPIFNPSASSTFRHIPCSADLCNDLPRPTCAQDYSYSSNCQYVYSYGDSSYTSGDLAYDTLTLPDLAGHHVAVSNIAFGCGYDNENSNFAGADGILGLGQGPLSFPSQLGISRFSYCLQSMGDGHSQTSPLFLGEGASLSSAPPSSIRSTPIISNPDSQGTYYYVSIEGITVGGTPSTIASDAFYSGVIFDSGTTLTYLQHSVYDHVLDLFRSKISATPVENSGTGLDLCYQGLPRNVPSLTFRFGGGADMLLPVSNYFVAVQENLVCLALASSVDISIIGNIQQQNFHVLYDLHNQRISFAPVNCDTL